MQKRRGFHTVQERKMLSACHSLGFRAEGIFLQGHASDPTKTFFKEQALTDQ